MRLLPEDNQHARQHPRTRILCFHGHVRRLGLSGRRSELHDIGLQPRRQSYVVLRNYFARVDWRFTSLRDSRLLQFG